jgi:hypothetical protein
MIFLRKYTVEESCLAFPGNLNRIHKGFEDYRNRSHEGGCQSLLRRVRDEIENPEILAFLNKETDFQTRYGRFGIASVIAS